MASKKPSLRSEAREKVLRGATQLAEGVRITLGPKKVVRIALENAVSVASTLLLTEATMTEIPGEKGASERLPSLGNIAP